MTTLSEKLDSMVVRATSPDGQIMATLANLRSVSLAFRDASFQTYGSTQLEGQLGALLTTVWTTHHTGLSDLFANEGDLPPAKEEWDANRRRYHAAVRELDLRGVSMSNLVKVRSTGMRSFQCRIKPDYLEAVSEQGFVAEFNSALQSLEIDRRNQVAQLKDRHFDLRQGRKITISLPNRPQ